MGSRSDIDRLIELGLNRYGAGDLDGAMLMWEEALAVDPDNERATSYIDYVQLNYELLSTAEPTLAPSDDAPFGIEEEPEYQIEVTPGQLAQSGARPVLESVDTGWFSDEQTHDDGSTDDRSSEPLLELELELGPTGFEADGAPTIEAREPDPDPAPGDEPDFEDSTREYNSARLAGLPLLPPRPSDFQDGGTGEFQSEETTGGFRSESTPLGFSENTQIRKRDLGFVQVTGEQPEATGEKTFDRGAFAPESTDDDLLATNPRMRPRPPASITDAETQDIPLLRDQVRTRDLPDSSRPPARRDTTDLSQAEVMMTAQKTRKFDPSLDMGTPTRDLGLRPKSNPPLSSPPLSNPDDEEQPTKQSDVRAIREAAGTHTDIVLPFDPIDARTEQILAEVDAGAPADEARDEMTRRRIGALLERAQAWSDKGEVDRAVAAVDLALSEDPNSVLAQKLITRNRETIMAIFATFVGDMARMPQLTRPLHELQGAPISPRAAFLLSRVDGQLTIDELLDVSGMPRMEAYRYLCQLFLRGILR